MPKPAGGSGKGPSNTETTNTIYGTDGADELSGLGGAFALSGGKGDDTYIVDSDDTVEEKNRGGVDQVIAYADWTLGAFVENLTLAGTDDLSGAGNSLDNVVTGNDGDNLLSGFDGDDTLVGSGGSDFIDGGDGVDTAIFDGLFASYSFEWSGADLLVADANGDTDILRNVEYLSFNDTLVAASEIAVSAPTAPAAVADAASVAEDNSVAIQILSNDAGDGLSVLSITNGGFGSVTVNANGSVTYSPDPDANGVDNFSYTVIDAYGATSSALVTVEVNAVNDAPVANGDVYSAGANQTYSSAQSVLANDIDVDGDMLLVAAYDATSAGGGGVHMNTDGTFSYTPAAGFIGVDSFAYTVTDGLGGAADATVSINVEDASAPPYYVTGLIYGDPYRLNYPGDIGASVQVTYAFLTDVPAYYGASHPFNGSFEAFSDLQIQAVREVLTLIESFTNIDFVETTPDLAGLTFGMADLDGRTGIAYKPLGGGVGETSSDVWLDLSYSGDPLAPGTDPFTILLHELGHALGLDHPDLPVAEESQQYTVMDLLLHPTMYDYVSGYQLYDIAALQYLYGVNAGYASGDDVYSFNEFDGVIKTIWDGGGRDVLDMSSADYAIDLDLGQGAFSTVAAVGEGNLAIALGTVIEDAIGGAYDDRIAGNEADNQLTGGGGRDVFEFASNWGDDTITDFQRGADQLDFIAAGVGFADFTITSSHGDTLIAYGDDSLLLEGIATVDEGDFLIA